MEYKMLFACGSIKGQVGDLKANQASILEMMHRAEDAQAQVLVLPRLCITGATAGDLMQTDLLLSAALKVLEELVAASQTVLCVVGLPVMQENRIFEASALVQGGELISLQLHPPKGETPEAFQRAYPTYSVRGIQQIKIGNHLFALAGDLEEARVLRESGVDIIALPVATEAFAGEALLMPSRLCAFIRTYGGTLLYANAGATEGTTDGVYSGQCILSSEGRAEDTLPFAEDAFLVAAAEDLSKAYEMDEGSPLHLPYAPNDPALYAQFCEDCIEIPARALALRMRRIKAERLTVGLSGGLDSTMALLVALRALEIENLSPGACIVITMPGPGSSGRTLNSARQLCEALGLSLWELPITKTIENHLLSIGHGITTFDSTFENAQARERTQILMGVANMEGGIMVGSGDMSELALGFTTYGGDHMSMYGVNAGLPKTVIRLALRYLADKIAQEQSDKLQWETNRSKSFFKASRIRTEEERQQGRARIALMNALLRILDTPISPELVPGGHETQKTEEIVGAYEVIDFYLWHWMQTKDSPDLLLEKAEAAFADLYPRKVLVSTLQGFFRRFFANQFKRSCMPDGPQVIGLSLSPRGGLQMPSDASNALWLEALEQL